METRTVQKNFLLCFTEGQSYTFGGELGWINADRIFHMSEFDLPSVQVCSLLLYVAKDITTASCIVVVIRAVWPTALPFVKTTCIVFLCLLISVWVRELVTNSLLSVSLTSLWVYSPLSAVRGSSRFRLNAFYMQAQCWCSHWVCKVTGHRGAMLFN